MQRVPFIPEAAAGAATVSAVAQIGRAKIGSEVAMEANGDAEHDAEENLGEQSTPPTTVSDVIYTGPPDSPTAWELASSGSPRVVHAAAAALETAVW